MWTFNCTTSEGDWMSHFSFMSGCFKSIGWEFRNLKVAYLFARTTKFNPECKEQTGTERNNSHNWSKKSSKQLCETNFIHSTFITSHVLSTFVSLWCFRKLQKVLTCLKRKLGTPLRYQLFESFCCSSFFKFFFFGPISLCYATIVVIAWCQRWLFVGNRQGLLAR